MIGGGFGGGGSVAHIEPQRLLLDEMGKAFRPVDHRLQAAAKAHLHREPAVAPAPVRCNVRARVVVGPVVCEAAAAAFPLKSVSHEPALRIRNVGLWQGQRVLKQRQNCRELILQRLHGCAHFVHADAHGLLLAAQLLQHLRPRHHPDIGRRTTQERARDAPEGCPRATPRHARK